MSADIDAIVRQVKELRPDLSPAPASNAASISSSSDVPPASWNGELSPTEGLASRLVDGGSFILDAPEHPPALWGDGQAVLWARGESLLIVAEPGVGKTTLAGLLIRGRLGLSGDVLGLPVRPGSGRVLLLAGDRPAQARRALARQFCAEDRPTLAERLRVWQGPPPEDIAQNPGLLLALARAAEADTVILDSLKDMAIGLSDDAVGGGYNRARQTALASGVELLELHHARKAGAGGGRPSALSDSYGSVWVTAGAGSVIALWGDAGDPLIEMHHLKQPSELVGPWSVLVDRERGEMTVEHAPDPIAVLRADGGTALPRDLARMAWGEEDPSRPTVERMRRLLEKAATTGAVERIEGARSARGGSPVIAYQWVGRDV